MSRSHRFSATDLVALSGVPRAFEIFEETLDDEVRAELESFAGSKTSRPMEQIRRLDRYITTASLHERDLFYFLGCRIRSSDSYPAAIVHLETKPRVLARDVSIVTIDTIAIDESWRPYDLDDPSGWAGIGCERNLASFLAEEDHVAAVKRFFIESIR